MSDNAGVLRVGIPLKSLLRSALFRLNKQSSENAKNFVEGFRRLREEGTFCDIKIKVGNVEIVAHKTVLCACSPYFNTMFTGPFVEAGLSEIEMKYVDGDSLRILIDFLYTGTLQFTADNVESVLLAANFLQVTSAEKLCSNYLIVNLNAENVLHYIKFAGSYSLHGLLKNALQVAVIYFHRMFCDDEYLTLDVDVFFLLVRILVKSKTHEDSLFAFVMRWVNYSYTDRQSYIKDFLELLNPKFISRNILLSEKIINRPNCFLDDWRAEFREAPNPETRTQILISKRVGSFRARTFNIFEPSSEQTPIENLPSHYNDGSYSCNGYYIYHHGGWDAKRTTDEAFVFDQNKRIWMSFTPLLKARAYHRSCVMDNTIFIAGGSDGHVAIASMEFMDLCSAVKSQSTPLPRAKELMAFAPQNHELYSIGGKDRAIPLPCVHRFDTRVGKWELLASTPYIPGASSCALIDNHIYTTHSGGMQRYDIRTNKWTLIRTQYNRYPDEVFSLQQEVYGLFKDHIARYNQDNGRWLMHHQFRYHQEYLHVVTNLVDPTNEPDTLRINLPDEEFFALIMENEDINENDFLE